MIKKISSEEVVEVFLRFFEGKNHTKIPGHSLLPNNDPSLLFINSGMAPLKPYFLGQEKPPAPDLCNIQRCLRTNDIEEVGDRHHLTFFEMMGSWSIGNYWKEEAITLAWELLTNGFGYPPEKLYATVYKGNPALNIPPDEASLEIWRRIGLHDDHIVPLGEDNFWGPAGEFGPCGPCTEVFFDTGDAFGQRYTPGGYFDDVNRYIEIWNAGVFMEYNKLPSGMSKLDMRSVDTGSGLERMVMALNGCESVYETDLLGPLVDFTTSNLGSISRTEKAPRLISDHIRASMMLLGDGVKPAASGPGYIPRRLIRRAIAAAYQAGYANFNFSELLDLAIANAKPWNPQIERQRSEIQNIFARERAEFESTLQAGIKRLEETYEAGNGSIDGPAGFTLFATYGLPIDTIREFARARGGKFDEEGFQEAFAEHQNLSRNPKSKQAVSAAIPKLEGMPETEFTGYANLKTTGTILGIYKDGAAVDEASKGDEIFLVLDKTTFYAEGGGQVGDRGRLTTADGACSVIDVTAPEPRLFVHKCVVETGVVREGDKADLAVDTDHRRAVQANHSATHLLHSALRKLLGEGVGQAGSLVDADRLRFDFTYGEKVPDEALAMIEETVNQAVWAGHDQVQQSMAYEDAIAAGALAFFADKYDAQVRTISFGDVSTELCGGTHVQNTADIGLFVIVSEGSVARGVRRIQAVTSEAAYRLLRDRDRTLQRISKRLNTKIDDVEDRIGALLDRAKSESGTLPASGAVNLAKDAITLPNKMRAVIASPDIPGKQFRQTAVETASEIKGVVVLAGASDGKARITVAVDSSRTHERDASKILGELLPLIEGRGGGKAALAEGAGSRTDGVASVIELANSLIRMPEKPK